MQIPGADVREARAVLIAGPTGSGKSALALALAEAAAALGREPVIVNADSIQVYDGLRILTARPGPGDLARAPHALYGHVSPAKRYSVGRWLADAAPAVGGAAGNRLPILAGGAGLYFDAALSGLAAVPDIADGVRGAVAARMEAEGPVRLHACLAARDPAAAASIRPTDRQRIVRALEVLQGTGRSITAWQREAAAPLIDPSSVVRLVLSPPREVLYARIERRLDAMLDAGVLEEVAALTALRLDPGLPAMKAIGVKEFSGVLANEVPLEEALAQAKTRTRRYAKRQLTWFRNRMADWTWLDPPSGL